MALECYHWSKCIGPIVLRKSGGCVIILHYVTAIKIKLSLVIIVTWHFVPFSRDSNLELRIVVYVFLSWPCKHYNFQTCLHDNLVPRMLEMAFQNFQIFKFSGGACPQTPLGCSVSSYSRLLFSNQLPIETPELSKGHLEVIPINTSCRVR